MDKNSHASMWISGLVWFRFVCLFDKVACEGFAIELLESLRIPGISALSDECLRMLSPVL